MKGGEMTDSEKSKISINIGDVEDHTVDDITGMISGTGVRMVAEDKGVVLWAEIFAGRAVDYRAFGPSGVELPVVRVTVPIPNSEKPQEGHRLRSHEEGATPRKMPDDCLYICASLGDGGYVCWKKC